MSAENSPHLPDESSSLADSQVPQLPPAGPPTRRCASFRFLQASDFRLDTPCPGVSDLPGRLQERLVEARYVAAERVFDAAIERDVDFVVLAGGLLNSELPGLRGPWFLADQFRRLARHDIDVYWAGASLETRGRWPAHLDLPTNVHRLTADATPILHGRNGHPVARLLSLPAGSTQRIATDSTFTIAVQPRCSNIPEDFGCGVDMWALGGLPNHETAQAGGIVAHFAGSPQGRSAQEIGSHSCSLVSVDEHASVGIEPVETDVVRWHHRRLNVEGDTSWSDLEAELEQQQCELRTASGVDVHLLNWTVQGSGPAFERLLQPRLHAELMTRLNRSAAGGGSTMWTLDIHPVVAPQQQALWEKQQMPLGAFLRELDELAPQIPDLFGTSHHGPHPLGAASTGSQEVFIQCIVNAGVHWLGTEDTLLRPAA